MSTNRVGPFARVWYKWKALRLPWRKRFLAGYDLQGNTYWEFKLTREHTERWRRIVKYPRSTYLSAVKVSPQWHQWLRYTRNEPPTVDEQQGDVVRQAQLKQLAAAADARWEAKPRLMDAPKEAAVQRVPALEPGASTTSEAKSTQQDTRSSEPTKKENSVKQDDPWAKAKTKGPGEEWQPSSWTPTPTKKR